MFRYLTRPSIKTTGDISAMINIYHDDAVLRTFILFIQTARSALKFADAHLYGKTRLSIIKLITLQALVSNDGVMIPTAIAEWTQTERHNITALIRRMQKEGLVTIERNTVDKRSVNVILTDKGRQVHRRAMPVAKEVVDQIMLSITEGDSNLLEKVLTGMRQNADQGLTKVTK